MKWTRGKEVCYRIYELDGTYHEFSQSGERISSFTVKPGNPEAL